MAKRVVSVVAALFVLGFTAVDLAADVFAYPSCESDLHTSPRTPASFPAQGESDESSSDVHHDDCFCCSHCVRASVWFSLPQESAIQGFDVVEQVDSAFVLAHGLFHPPQLS